MKQLKIILIFAISFDVYSSQLTYNITNPALGGYNPGFVNSAKERISIVERKKSEQERINREIERNAEYKERNNPSRQLERVLVQYINSQVADRIAKSMFDDSSDSGSINVSEGLDLSYEKVGERLTIRISGESGDQTIELGLPEVK
ncbi:curli assembly protein CsgF [Vibrio mediterranei]|uniref:curli assembly protein CsgF n=2 Tax=Vibrio mediterranei TaxID=689 RepID=UPI00406850FA